MSFWRIAEPVEPVVLSSVQSVYVVGAGLVVFLLALIAVGVYRR